MTTKSGTRLPNLVIIGAMKSGTSSLHQYLNLHPQIHMAPAKELNFFVREQNWQRGLKWYQSNFVEEADIIGESSPNYTKYQAYKDVPERMHQIIPKAKLIYIVRDPIKRIVSHYIHLYSGHRENRSFARALRNLDRNHYVNCSLYAAQLEQFLPYYSLERILVVSFEVLISDPTNTLSQIFHFLEVDETFEHPNFSTVFHQSREKRLSSFGKRISILPGGMKLCHFLPKVTFEPIDTPIIDELLHDRLADRLHEDVVRFRALTGNSFSSWSL